MKAKKCIGLGVLIVIGILFYNGAGTRFFERLFGKTTTSRVAKNFTGGVPKAEVMVVEHGNPGSQAFYDRLATSYKMDIVKEMEEYGITKTSLTWQVGGGGPVIAWLDDPLGLDLYKLKKLARPLYVPEGVQSTRMDKRVDVINHVLRHQSIPINQIWLGYEDAENYYFSGGGSRPIFDYSAGTIVVKESGAIYYWIPGMRDASERPRLRKVR